MLITGFALMVPAGYAATVDMGSKTHQVSANPSMTFLQVLASVGPLEYLSGATVTLKDAQGQVKRAFDATKTNNSTHGHPGITDGLGTSM